MKISKELLKGSTTLLILQLLQQENMYGYQIVKELEQRSDHTFSLKEGTLYPLLHSLEEKGLVYSYWEETASARKRKYYGITEPGKRELKERQAEWLRFSRGINQVMGGACLE